MLILEFNPDHEPNFDNPLPIKVDDDVSNNASVSDSGSESDEFEFDDDNWQSFVDFDVVKKMLSILTVCVK